MIFGKVIASICSLNMSGGVVEQQHQHQHHTVDCWCKFIHLEPLGMQSNEVADREAEISAQSAVPLISTSKVMCFCDGKDGPPHTCASNQI